MLQHVRDPGRLIRTSRHANMLLASLRLLNISRELNRELPSRLSRLRHVTHLPRRHRHSELE